MNFDPEGFSFMNVYLAPHLDLQFDLFSEHPAILALQIY